MKKLLLTATATALAFCISAQKRAFTIQDIYRIKSVYSFSLSPKEDKIAMVHSSTDLPSHSSTSKIVVQNLKSIGAKTDTINIPGNAYSPQWNKNGDGLYYTASTSFGPQLFHISLQSGTITQITNFEIGVSAPLVSPDNRYIAFTAKVYPNIGADGKLNAELIKKKNEGPVQAHIADKLLYRHWTGYADGRVQHIIVYDTKFHTYTDITPGDYESPVFSPSGAAGNFCFSPDSEEICYTSNHTANPESNTNCDLWVVSVEGGTPRCLTACNHAWDGSPRYSPDGKWIAYRTQTVESYESDKFRLALINRTTGKTTTISESFDNWVDDFEWDKNSNGIYFTGEQRGYTPLFYIDLKHNKIRRLITSRAISAFTVSSDDYAYYSYSSTGKPSALYRSKLSRSGSAEEQQLTFLNSELEAKVDFRPSEVMWVIGADGDSVEVFIVKPHNFNPAQKYPLIVNVHGGPQMQWMDSFRADWQVYPGAGYVVAYPNPHGSTGYGQAFTHSISGDWGGKPYTDVMQIAQTLANLPYIDSTRMGAMGWSYGGYFMNWLQGQKHPFKCLASMMGLYDLTSMWGSTEELWFPNFELQGQPWNSQLYRKFSPSEYVKNFKTPALIITGERDYRVPYTQSLQYFSALQTLGIPSRLIVFKNDGHWPSHLNSMPVYYNAHLEWFHKYLGGAPAPWNTQDMINNQIDYQ